MVAALLIGGCAAHTSGPGLEVSAEASGMDSPLTIKASGLSAQQRVTISVSSTDALGVEWTSEASYIADSHGAVDSRTSSAVSGSFTGADRMGLLTFMRPSANSKPNAQYLWGATPSEFRFELHLNGRTVGSATINRSAATASTNTRALTLQGEGFLGTYSASKDTTSLSPAVLIIGGSEGGNSGALIGARLAAHGIRALSVAYFGEPGLPTQLSNIPLEYFATALTWLRHQPGVDPHRVWIIGGSRGSEAALLVGVHYPELVNGVIVNAPSSVSICSYPSCDGPAWTLGGAALPYTRQFNAPAPTDDPAAIIPVSKIVGPLLAVCGKDDTVWHSCTYGHAIIAQLAKGNGAHAHALLTYEDAGHLGSVLPYQPGSTTTTSTGGTAIGTGQALATAWPKEIGFILSGSRG